MTPDSNSSASKSNPHLKPLSILIGEWKTVGKHPMMPCEGSGLDLYTN